MAVSLHLPLFPNLSNFIYLILPASFRRGIRCRWYLLSGVSVRGSKRSHAGGKCV